MGNSDGIERSEVSEKDLMDALKAILTTEMEEPSRLKDLPIPTKEELERRLTLKRRGKDVREGK